MSKITGNKTARKWILRLIIVFTISQITELGIGYCLAGYFLSMFLFDFVIRLFSAFTGIMLMLILMFILIIGLLTI